MDIRKRHNVTEHGRGSQPMLFAHGFGCDQNMWRFVAPGFDKDYRVVLFDHAGWGKADSSAWDRSRHGRLEGYAKDVLEICAGLELQRVIYVGHSVSSMIGILAAIERPELFEKLVLVCPSPAYINDGDYVGGFNRSDIDGLLNSLDDNYLGWSSTLSQMVINSPERPQFVEELKNSICRTDPAITRQFAQVTFLSDNREDLPKVKAPSLVIQCARDIIAPAQVGEYVHRRMPRSTLVRLNATGHCPNLTAPAETIAAMKPFLESRA